MPRPSSNRQVVIAAIPTGRLGTEHFALRDGAVPEPRDEEVLCRTILLSLDPVNAGLLHRGGDYRPGLGPGDVMAGFGVGEVVDPAGSGLRPGALVFGEMGWQEWAACGAAHLTPVVPRGPLTHAMSLYGVTAMTAYFGLLEVGRPRPGETVVVSAAAGATGNLVGQLARRAGCRAVGITSSAAKAEALLDLGFDAVALRRDDPRALRAELKDACPVGIDVYFDSVGGPLLDTCLGLMNLRGRVVCCGTLSAYDTPEPPPGPRGVPGLVVSKRLRLEGFVVLDFLERWRSAQDELADALSAGELRVLEEVSAGLESAPGAFVDLLAGGNLGKRMVRVGADPVL